MGRGRIIFTDKKIAEKEANGDGQGDGEDYKAWFAVQDFSSRGIKHRPKSRKTGRTLQLVSDGELYFFLMMEWLSSVHDIREQFPLPRELTRTIARELGVKHPCYPGTHTDLVLTTDFVITRQIDNRGVVEAWDVKETIEGGDENDIIKLEIVRSAWAALDIAHYMIFKEDMPQQRVANLQWLRGSMLAEKEHEDYPGYWADLQQRMLDDIAGIGLVSMPLYKYAQHFEEKFGVAPGHGLRTARMLMENQVLEVDINQPDIVSLPMSAFSVKQASKRLRAVWG